MVKRCARCRQELDLNEINFYPLRKKDRKEGWQSNCIPCWKIINKENKERRKQAFNYGVI